MPTSEIKSPESSLNAIFIDVPNVYPHECDPCWDCGGCWDCGTCTCHNIPTPEQEEKTPDDPDEE